MCAPAFYQAMQGLAPYVGGDRANDLGLRMLAARGMAVPDIAPAGPPAMPAPPVPPAQQLKARVEQLEAARSP